MTATSIDLQATLQNLYSVFEQFQDLHLSFTGLLVIGLLFALAFLFAIREAATWFFKVDDLKRDISHLHEVTTQLEGQIRVVQTILTQFQEAAPGTNVKQFATATSAATPAAAAAAAEPAKAAKPIFPINH